MKTPNVKLLGLSLLMASLLTGCGNSQDETKVPAKADESSAQQSEAANTTDESSVSEAAPFEAETIGTDSLPAQLSNVTFDLKSVHFQTVPAATKTLSSSKKVSAATEAAYETFTGILTATETTTGTVKSFDWLAKIDAAGMVALSNKTLLLSPGTYSLDLLLENGGKQYVGTSSLSVQDSDQIQVSFNLHAVIGDVITDVSVIDALATFELNFPADELAGFDNPRVGVIINGGDENIYTISKSDGKPEGVINVAKGDEVFMKFYDGGLQKGKSDVVTAEGGTTMVLTFRPLYGEVDVAGIGDANGTIDMAFKVPAEIIEEAGDITNVSALLTYLNGSTYNEVLLNLAPGAASWEANHTIENASYDTLGYSVIFSKKNDGQEIGRCTQAAFDLTKDEATKTCQIDLKRGIVMDASFEGVAGFNIYDEVGDALPGMSIYADDAFIGFTGSGTFGSKGYLKSYFKAGDYVITASSDTRSYAKAVTIKPLSVNNYEFLIPSGLPEGSATLSKSAFTTPAGTSEAASLNVSNVGLGILYYDVTIQTALGTDVKVIKRAVPQSAETFVIGSGANNTTGLMTFDYIKQDGSVESKTIDYADTANRVIIKYRDGSSKVKSSKLAKPSGFEVKKIDAKTAGEYLTGVNALLSDPDIEYIEPDQKLHLYADTYFSLQWGHHNDGSVVGYADVDVDWKEFNDAGHTLATTIVGVIDTGVDYTHPDLAANIWTNAGEIAGNGLDDDGNGYVDDIHGYDFYAGDADPMDENGHGTHVSGIIAAAENGIGVVGINAHAAKIMALRFLGPDGSGYTSGAVLALEYAVNNGAHLTNNSWGGGGYSVAMYDMIAQAMAANQLFVAAAGNDNVNIDTTPTYPASYNLANVITVGSSDYYDAKSSFSNYGVNSVDLLAPGSEIASTYPNNQYVYASGTSMASPYVAGVASLLVGKNTDAPFEIIKEMILSHGDQTPAGLSFTASGNRLNANTAFNAFDPNQEWLILSGQLSGELQENETRTLGVTVDASYLSSGTVKEGNISVRFNSDTTSLPVTLTVH